MITLNHLLWPFGPSPAPAPSKWADELELGVLARALDVDGRHGSLVRELLGALSTDAPTIRFRQAMQSDLRTNPALARTVESLLPALASLKSAGRDMLWASESALLSAARRLGELELYVSTVTTLRAALAEATLVAEGWRGLREEMEAIARDPTFQRLEQELPALRHPLRQLASVTIGVNLDAELHPTGATLLAIHEHEFSGRQALLARLLGKQEEHAGLTPLRPASAEGADPFSTQLLRDLEKVVGNVGQALADGLARYSRLSGSALSPLHDPFAFYLGARRLAQTLEAAQLPLVMPELRPLAERHSSLEGMYDVTLALRLLAQGEKAELVLNDLRLDEEGRLALLTGPNRGGKTTFTRAIGLAHVMAQAGLPVAAQSATLSPVDAIFTQFASGESHTVGFGRFDEEVHQLASIFDHATPASLILINEPLSGTSPDEALHIARGVVQGLQLLGARTLLATHLHALAQEAPALTDARPSAPVVSLVASPSEVPLDEGVPRSFHIRRGPPLGQSRALEIARQHGLSPEQVSARLHARGIGGEIKK